MKIHVLIAGIADPKWPLPSMLDATTLEAHAVRHAALSPFDEAALELALKLRAIDATHTLHAIVAGSEAFARKVAEWRLDAVLRLEAGGSKAWDPFRYAAGLAGALDACPGSALVLIGREFGDYDDGAVPPMVAHKLGVPYFSLTTEIALRDGALWGVRQHAGRVERFRIPERAVLAVTNDPSNRLRHPLLKNVMAARKLAVPAVQAAAAEATVELLAMEAARPAQRGAACRMLAGSVDEQSQALAQVLLGAGANA